MEMAQICGQIGPMMEALKLLTCDVTVDLNQTEMLNSSLAGGCCDQTHALVHGGLERSQQSLPALL